MTPLLAHAGHVLVDGLMFGGPVVALLIGLLVVRRMGGLPGERED
ncbi:MAG TPA: hypothetical protein VFR97_11240 [Capillimicrobium sp.]|nr:hypothetical protein [Capillimicrobium sp.]